MKVILGIRSDMVLFKTQARCRFMRINKGDRGVLSASSEGLTLAVNGLNHGNECVVVEVLEDDRLVVLDLEQIAVEQDAVEKLGYPGSKGFLLIGKSQFELRD